MEKIHVKVAKTEEYKELALPKYQTEYAAGIDLVACIDQDLILQAEKIVLVPTGLMMEIPDGYEAQIRPRSGLALKHGISMVNTPGTIDADYRGEIKIIMINHGSEDFRIKRGDRIAQMVFNPIVQADFKVVTKLTDTVRGEEGFGHTGK